MVEIKSINSLCPGCGLVFGYVEANGKIECPQCHMTQTMPVILTSTGECYCDNCRCTFLPEATDNKCPGCGKQLSIQAPSPPAA